MNKLFCQKYKDYIAIHRLQTQFEAGLDRHIYVVLLFSWSSIQIITSRSVGRYTLLSLLSSNFRIKHIKRLIVLILCGQKNILEILIMNKEINSLIS